VQPNAAPPHSSCDGSHRAPGPWSASIRRPRGGHLRLQPVDLHFQLPPALSRDHRRVERGTDDRDVVGSFSSVVVASETVETVGRPDPDIPAWEDWEWYLRLATECRFDAVDEALTIRHNDGDQLSRMHRLREVAYPVLQRRIDELAPTPRDRRVGGAYLDYWLGRSALSNGHYREARRSILRAIRRYPRDPTFYGYLACAGRHYPAVRRLKRGLLRALR